MGIQIIRELTPFERLNRILGLMNARARPFGIIPGGALWWEYQRIWGAEGLRQARQAAADCGLELEDVIGHVKPKGELNP